MPDNPFTKNWDYKREALPYWEPPTEAWYENDQMKKFPLTFMSERGKFKCHTQFSYSPTLLELDPEPSVMVNPDDAAARGITTGDMVKVFNDRGYVVLKAVIHNGLRPGVLSMDHGWQADQFVDGHYNDVSGRNCSDSSTAPCWFDTLCEIEKVEG